MKSKKIVIVVLILLILVGGFIGYQSVKNYRSSNILLSLFKDARVHDDMTCFIDGKQVTIYKAYDSNSYAYVFKFKPDNFYHRAKDSEKKHFGTSVGKYLKIDNYEITLYFTQGYRCYHFNKKCIASGKQESSINVTVVKDGKLSNYLKKIIKKHLIICGMNLKKIILIY